MFQRLRTVRAASVALCTGLTRRQAPANPPRYQVCHTPHFNQQTTSLVSKHMTFVQTTTVTTIIVTTIKIETQYQLTLRLSINLKHHRHTDIETQYQSQA
jgi:hypothetical protein